ncbi:MAG: glycosyltransferase family 2 protein [Thermoproteota archaeon]|jgi:GT2 family glycosyltransferase
MQFPKVSVIVLNYNGKKFIVNCLRSLLLTKYPNFEVLFVDNSSTDGSREWLEEEIKRLKLDNFKLIPLDKNYGFAKGNNIGINLSDSKSEFVVLLNNDTEVEPDWIEKLVKFMVEHKEVGIAQCKLRSLKNRALIDSAGGVIDYIGRVLIIGSGEPDDERFSKPYEIFYAQGAAIVIRRDLLKKVGLLDEEYFINYEETDLCWRTWLNGMKVAFISNSIVYHYGSATISSGTEVLPKPLILYHSRKNQVSTLIKNYSTKNVVKYVTYLYVRYILFTLSLIFKKRITYALEYLKAMVWPIVNLRILLTKRKFVQKYIRKVSDGEVMKRMLDLRVYESIKPQIVKRNLMKAERFKTSK